MTGTAGDRRTFLRLVGGGSALALAGCLGGEGFDGANANDGETETTTQTSGGANDSVSARYVTATGLSGRQRDPDSLTDKATVAYQPNPSDGQGCSGCQHFIPPKGDDKAGACVLVEGRIQPDAWCKLFSPTG